MKKKNVIAIAAAAALMFGAANASAGSGHGGHGGHGGSHGGGSHSGGNNNDIEVKNYNKNSNFNANFNKNSNKNYNNNYNKNTNTNNNTNNNNNINQNNSNASANANATSNSSGGDGGSSSVNVSGDEAAASGAAPVYLTSSNDTCMGSSGIGAQGMSFGVSLGTTWTDSNCIMLKNARELKVQGHEKAAKARLCMDEDNAMAFELAGEPCPRALATSQAAVAKMREHQADYMAASASETQTAQRRATATEDQSQE
ncbi:MAG: hypothetical protein GEU87_12965 [Alphaproteobacteria bacterium]|nr:hypothetical protein [Alphaproteobacteria bacterium]